ncbi:MAG: signal peptidase II [Algisphaera sp.]
MADTSQASTVLFAGRSPKAIALFFILTAMVLAADLGVKAWSFRTVAGTPVVLTDLAASNPPAFWQQYPHDAKVVMPKVLNLRLTANTGAVFGLGKGQRWVFIVVSAVATGAIGLLFYRSPRTFWVLHVALALILAGALGNLYDRWHYAAVRDMLHMLPGVHLPFGFSWPGGLTEVWPWIFNIADVALMWGVGLVLLVTFFVKEPSSSRVVKGQSHG